MIKKKQNRFLRKAEIWVYQVIIEYLLIIAGRFPAFFSHLLPASENQSPDS